MPERVTRLRGPRWLGTLPLSLALHAVVVLAAVWLLRTEASLPALMIDLNAIVADAGTPRAGSAGGSPPGRPDASIPAAPRRAPGARAPSAPAGPSPSIAPAPPPPLSAPAPRTASSPVGASSPGDASPARPPASPEVDAHTRTSERPADVPSPGASAQSGGDPAAPAPGAALPSGVTADAAAPGGGGPSARSGVDVPRNAPSGIGGSGGLGAAGGDRLALAIPGGDGGGPDTEYAAYLGRLRERLQQTLRYPPAAQRRGITGTVQLEIAIERDGAVSTVSLAASSSHEALDRAALDAARALPRQPFPADVRARPLKVRVPVTFRLQ